MAIEYEVRLKDGVSGPAKQAAASTDKLGSSLSRISGGLGGLGSGLFGFADKVKQVSGGVSGLGDAAGSSGGSIGAMAGPIGIAAVAATAAVAVFMKLASAATDIAISVAKFAFESAESKQQLLLHGEALLGSASAANELADKIDDIAAKGILTGDALEKMATGLAGAGYKGKELSKALDSVAIASSSGLEGAGEAATKLYGKIAAAGGSTKLAAKQIAAMGLAGVLKEGKVNAEQLGDAIKKRFGDVAEKQMLGLGAQTNAFKHNLSELFEDVDWKPFLKGLQSILGLFDQNTQSGKMFKTIMGGAFQAISNASEKVFPFIKTAILGVIIAGLKFAIVLKPIGKEIDKISEAFGGMSGGITVMDLIVANLKILGFIAEASAGFILYLVRSVARFVELASAGSEAASGLISGLVDGISNGVGRVVEAAQNLAGKVKGAIKGALGIASPSKVMLEMGHKGVGEGFAQGVEAAIPRVSGATGKLAGAAATGVSARPTATAASRGGATINIAAINIDGAGKSALQITELMVATTFERIALAQGMG